MKCLFFSPFLLHYSSHSKLKHRAVFQKERLQALSGRYEGHIMWRLQSCVQLRQLNATSAHPAQHITQYFRVTIPVTFHDFLLCSNTVFPSIQQRTTFFFFFNYVAILFLHGGNMTNDIVQPHSKVGIVVT